jgi:hypothetical protein
MITWSLKVALAQYVMLMFTFMMMNMSRFTPGTRKQEDPPPRLAADLQPDNRL